MPNKGEDDLFFSTIKRGLLRNSIDTLSLRQSISLPRLSTFHHFETYVKQDTMYFPFSYNSLETLQFGGSAYFWPQLFSGYSCY